MRLNVIDRLSTVDFLFDKKTKVWTDKCVMLGTGRGGEFFMHLPQKEGKHRYTLLPPPWLLENRTGKGKDATLYLNLEVSLASPFGKPN